MFKRNKLQRNFRRQMKEVEKDMLKKAKIGEGALANKLYRLRFYGYSDEIKKKSLIHRILSIIVFGIAAAITFIVVIAGLVFILLIIF